MTLPSPGSSSNYVVLKSGANIDQGIIFLTNVGKCPVFIHGTDSGGQPLDPANSLQLQPGEYAGPGSRPPPGSALIVGVTHKECSDNSALSYDPCAGIV